MKRMLRLALVGCCAAVIGSAGVMVVWATAPPDHSNRIDVTFHETPSVITDQVSAFGIRQLILTSTWTFPGFGQVSDVTSVTQDTAVHPCGPGSSSESGTRRIVASEGTLVLREGGTQCLTASGPVFTGGYVVDGNASTGIFAGAEGSGTVTVHLAVPPQPGTTRLSGRLKLAR